MYHHRYTHQTIGHTRLIASLMIVSLIVAGCGSLMPAQDCGNVQNVQVKGQVRNSAGDPIPNAELSIRTIEASRCFSAAPFEDAVFSADQDGNFDYVIDSISEDEHITLIVTSSGYLGTQRDGTYALFDDDLIVELLSE